MSVFEWLATSGVIAAVIIIIGVLLVWRIVKDRKRARAGIPIADERTQRINGRAATMALNAGSAFIIAILIGVIVAREFLGMPSFGERFYSYSLIAVLLVQSLSSLLLRWYLGRKGDS